MVKCHHHMQGIQRNGKDLLPRSSVDGYMIYVVICGDKSFQKRLLPNNPKLPQKTMRKLLLPTCQVPFMEYSDPEPLNPKGVLGVKAKVPIEGDEE